MKAFLFVDCQNDFFPGGNLAVETADEIRPTLKKLIKLAKEDNIPILKTMDCHVTNDEEFKKFPPHCIEGTEGYKSIEETDVDGAVIFNKQTYDVFDKKLGNKDITKWLKDNKITEVWVSGVVDSICVRAAVLGLLRLGITTYVFKNAIAGLDELSTKEAIDEMKKNGALMATVGL